MLAGLAVLVGCAVALAGASGARIDAGGAARWDDALEQVARLPASVRAVLIVEDLEGAAAALEGTPVLSLAAATLLPPPAMAAWQQLADRLGWTPHQTLIELLGRRAVLAIGDGDGAWPGARDAPDVIDAPGWVLISRVRATTARRLIERLDVAPRRLDDGLVVLALEGGAFRLVIAMDDPQADEDPAQATMLLAPAGAEAMLDAVTPALRDEARPALRDAPSMAALAQLPRGSVAMLIHTPPATQPAPPGCAMVAGGGRAGDFLVMTARSGATGATAWLRARESPAATALMARPLRPCAPLTGVPPEALLAITERPVRRSGPTRGGTDGLDAADVSPLGLLDLLSAWVPAGLGEGVPSGREAGGATRGSGAGEDAAPAAGEDDAPRVVVVAPAPGSGGVEGAAGARGARRGAVRVVIAGRGEAEPTTRQRAAAALRLDAQAALWLSRLEPRGRGADADGPRTLGALLPMGAAPEAWRVVEARPRGGLGVSGAPAGGGAGGGGGGGGAGGVAGVLAALGSGSWLSAGLGPRAVVAWRAPGEGPELPRGWWIAAAGPSGGAGPTGPGEREADGLIAWAVATAAATVSDCEAADGPTTVLTRAGDEEPGVVNGAGAARRWLAEGRARPAALARAVLSARGPGGAGIGPAAVWLPLLSPIEGVRWSVWADDAGEVHAELEATFAGP